MFAHHVFVADGGKVSLNPGTKTNGQASLHSGRADGGDTAARPAGSFPRYRRSAKA